MFTEKERLASFVNEVASIKKPTICIIYVRMKIHRRYSEAEYMRNRLCLRFNNLSYFYSNTIATFVWFKTCGSMGSPTLFVKNMLRNK